MIPEIAKIYDESILNEAKNRFGFIGELEDLGGFESHVYCANKDDIKYILKITHTIRRHKDYLLGEIEYVNHLFDGDVNVPQYIKSENYNFVEEIDATEGMFLAYSYKMVEGEIFDWMEFYKHPLWDNTFLKMWGKTAGRIVELSRNFKPALICNKRNEWFQEDLLINYQKYIPDDQIIIKKRIFNQIKKLKDIPKNSKIYGLAHGDLHHGNLCYDGEKLSVFDFDDCEYNFFSNEIAIPLSYGLMGIPESKKSQYITDFNENFLSGFKEETTIDDKELLLIPDFMSMRLMLLYILHYQEIGEENWDKQQPDYIVTWRNMIENEISLLDI